MASGTIEKQTLSSVDQVAGNAGEAERILDDAGMRPDRGDRPDSEQDARPSMTRRSSAVID